jgi:hypothetical protein
MNIDWPTFISSFAASSVVSALIAGWFNLRAKHAEYKNTYYKMILEERLTAYKQVESLITEIKMAVIDDADKKPYHFVFSDKDGEKRIYSLLFTILSKSLWLSDELFEKGRDLNYLVYANKPKDGDLTHFAKENYKKIGQIRTEIENIRADDLLSLADIDSFLRSKRRDKRNYYIDLPARK